MKSTLKKVFSLIISVTAVFVIAAGFAPNGSVRTLLGIKSGAVYVTADENLKKITVIPTDGEKITEEDISKPLKKNIKLPDGESVKNGAEIIIDREKYLLIIKGDALSDGRITAGDARAVLRITARLDDASDAVRDASDINSDGKITASEARDVLRFIAKLTDRLFNYTEDKTNLSESIKDEINSLPSDETTVPYYTTEDLKKYWRKSDGIHPNGKASEIYSFKIEEYMKKAYESYGYKWDNE